MVAKSYQNYQQVGEPYQKSKRWYIKVIHPKTNTEKEVRWYSEAEYERMYPEDEPVIKRFKTQKQVFGFDKGYITIFRGAERGDEFFRMLKTAYYRINWGWYIKSTEEVPEILPCGVEPIQLPWEAVGNEDGSLKNEDAIITALESILYPPTNSKFIGEIGERVELVLTVDKVIDLENAFGSSKMHIMHDNEGNAVIWTTSARSWAAGSQRLVRGTIKDHRVYKGDKQTILTRCVEL